MLEVIYFWLVVLLVCMGWYPCCGGGPHIPGVCPYCSADNNTITLTFSGIADGASCSQCDETLNGVAFVLTRNPFYDTCTYFTTYLSYALDSCTCSYVGSSANAFYQMYAQVRQLSPGTNKGWFASLRTSCGGHTDYAEYVWNSGSASWFDCTQTRTLTRTLWVPDPSETICNQGAASCQLN